jgi:hypothetical protein
MLISPNPHREGQKMSLRGVGRGTLGRFRWTACAAELSFSQILIWLIHRELSFVRLLPQLLSYWPC